MRGGGLELRSLASSKSIALGAEGQLHLAAENVGPFVALVDAQILRRGLTAVHTDHLLVGGRASGVLRQLDPGGSLAAKGPRMHSGVSGGGCADEFVQRHPIGLRQRKEQFKIRSALPRFQPRQGAGRDAGVLGELVQGQPAGLAESAQPPADLGEHVMDVVDHDHSLPLQQGALLIRFGLGMLAS